MLTTLQQELAAAWDALADWAMYILLPQGLEHVALGPIAGHPGAAQWLIRREARSDEPRRRQLAALLAGKVGRATTGADTDLLSELFESETRRVRERPREDDRSARASAIESAGVVAHLIDAAALWAMRPELRPAALELLRRILEAALAGESWTNLERAALILAKHGSREDRDILTRLHRQLMAGGDQGGAALLIRVLTGETEPFDDDRTALLFGERAAQEFHVAGEARDVLDRALEAAEAFDREHARAV